MRIIVPISDAERTPVGLLGVRFNLKVMWDALAEVAAGDGGYAFIVDQDNRLIGHKNPSMVLRGLDLSEVETVRRASDTGANRRLGPPEEHVAVDMVGEPVLFASAPITRARWTAIVETPVDEAFAAEAKTLRWSTAIVLLSVLIGSLYARYAGPAFAAPVQALTRTARAFGAGNFDVRAQELAPHSPPDEIDSLVTSFNEMAQTVSGAVTQERSARQELARLNSDLEARVVARTSELEAFTYSVSHDLRAPLRAVRGFSEAVLEDYGETLDRAGQDSLHRIAGAAERMDRLIQDLLAYSRLDRVDPTAQAVSLADVVADAHDSVITNDIREKVQLTVAEPLPLVWAHPPTLRQAVTNLLSNALKFVEPGTAPCVKVWAEPRAARVRLWVEDNGIGIAADHHERTWQVFERLHGVEAYPGTGIGLAIVKKGVERIGGTLGLVSSPGAGSRFWIELPTAGSAPRGSLVRLEVGDEQRVSQVQGG